MIIQVEKTKYTESLKYIVDTIIKELGLDYTGTNIDYKTIYNEENVLKEIQDGNLYLSNDQIFLSFCIPHSGNDYSYLVRADFIETFDRWSVCLFQEYVKNNEDLDSVVSRLKEFYKNKESIIKKELENEEEI